MLNKIIWNWFIVAPPIQDKYNRRFDEKNRQRFFPNVMFPRSDEALPRCLFKLVIYARPFITRFTFVDWYLLAAISFFCDAQ